MKVIESIKKRRSIRQYKDKPVEKEKISALLEAAFYSPSARNTKVWEFIVVIDKKAIEKVGKMKPHSHHALNSPLVIIVCSKNWQYWVEDCSIAAENILLEVVNQGLGACWIQCRNSFTADNKDAEEYIKSSFNIPKDMRVLCCIAIGYPAINITEHTIEEIKKEKIHKNKW